MSKLAQKIRNADSKGRIALGDAFANSTVIVERVSEDEVRVTRARVIPEREAWLYKNPKALAAVRRGLAEAREGRFAQRGPGPQPKLERTPR